MTTTLLKPILEAEVRGLGEIYSVKGSFNEALESLREFGINAPTSVRELAYARINSEELSLRFFGSYTSGGFLYLKNEPVLVALESPLLDLELAKQAVEANKKGNYFTTNISVYKKYRGQAEQDKNKSPQERNVLILPNTKTFSISTNSFNENELALFLFKNQTENYGNLLRKNKISEIPIWLVDKSYVDSKEESVLTLLWFSNFDGGSDLGVSGDLYCYGRVRGMFEKTLEEGRVLEKEYEEKVEKIESYTLNQIKYVLGKLKISELEEQILEELRKSS